MKWQFKTAAIFKEHHYKHKQVVSKKWAFEDILPCQLLYDHYQA
jgi:hypothetical protein